MLDVLPPLVLREEQELAVWDLLANDTGAALNGSKPSAGKTVMHVEQGLRMNAEVVVIIGPIGTVDGWQKTLRRQSHGKHELRWITSKKAGMAHYADLLAGKPGWYFIGREFFRGNKIEPEKIRADLGVVDEIQLYASRSSVGHKKLMHFKPDYRVACSGTWFGNKVENMWSVTRWLWPEKTDRSFWRWVSDWLVTEYDHFAGKKIVGEKKSGAYVNSLPLYIRIEPTLGELLQPEERWVDLSPMQRKMYDRMEKDMFVECESDLLVTEFPIVMRTRLRQLTMAGFDVAENGGVFFPEGVKSSKFDELKEIVEENPGEPMLVLSDSAQWVELAAARLGERAFAWRGGVSQDARNEAKAKFVAGEIQFIVGQIASLAEGVDELQLACNTVVWASQSDSPMMNEQSLARIHRTGQVEPVRQIFIKARDTIDDKQHMDLMEKNLAIAAALRKDCSIQREEQNV